MDQVEAASSTEKKGQKMKKKQAGACLLLDKHLDNN